MTKSERPHLIEEAIVPVAECELDNGLANVTRFLGTAFFIDNAGTFLTARHVLEEAGVTSSYLGVKLDPENHPLKNGWAKINDLEFAPNNLDLAIGKVSFGTKKYFEGVGSAQGIWKKVHTCGYPESTLVRGGNRFGMPLRGIETTIQRIINSEMSNDPRVIGKTYEIGAPIPKGMSGSPLLAHNGSYFELFGVCIGNSASELVDYEHIEVDEAKGRYSERKIRIEETGIAIAIDAFASWKPQILGGQTISTTLL